MGIILVLAPHNVAFPHEHAQTDFYVNPGGDDANDGTQAAPFRTIAHALAVVPDGSTIHVAGGTYHEGPLTVGGNGLALRGGYAPDDWSVNDPWVYHSRITGSGVAAGESTAAVIWLAGDNITLDGFKMNRASLQDSGVVVKAGADNAVIERLYVKGFANGVQVAGTASITWSLFESNHHGIAFIGATGSNSVSHNTIVAQQGSGVRIGANGGDGGDLTVTATLNIIVDNSAGLNNASGHAGVTFAESANDVWANGANYVNVTPSATSIHADPLFVDPWHGTYLVYASSPTRDLGGPGVDAGAFGAIADDAPLVVITIEEPTAGATTEGLHVCALKVNPGDYGTRQVGPCSQAPAYGEPITVTVPAAAVPGYNLYGVIVSFPDGAPAYVGPENQGGYWGFWDYLAGPAAFGHGWWHWTSGTRYTTASVAPPGTQALLYNGPSGLVVYGSPNALPFLRALLPGPEQADPIPQWPEPVGVNSAVTTVITRTSYTLDGVAVALRVAGDPDGGDGLYYLHGDHLGSLSLMTAGSGALVSDSMARFLPFGEYRRDGSGPVDGNDLSDRGFTGHYENREIGLTYMQSRYYAPELRRFISPDTLVPDPGASIAYNRFAYVNQNPLNFTDPTGHFSEVAIYEYLYNQYGDDWYTVHQAWQADTEWWELITTAAAGDTIFTSADTYGLYYHFAGEGRDVLAGVYTNWAPSPALRNASLSDIQSGSLGIVWGGWFTRNSSGQVVDVAFRDSVTRKFVYNPTKQSNTAGDVVGTVVGEGLETGICGIVGGGFLCSVGVNSAAGPIWSIINPRSHTVMGPEGAFMIDASHLVRDDEIIVSGGHVFSRHTAFDNDNNRKTRLDTTYYGHRPRVYPLWQLRVYYVYQ